MNIQSYNSSPLKEMPCPPRQTKQVYPTSTAGATTVKKIYPLTPNNTSSTPPFSQNMDEVDYIRNKCNDLETHFGQQKVQLDRALKQLSQRKAESELWKQKYETQVQQLVAIKSNYELEIRQLCSELQRVQKMVTDMSHEQNKQFTDQKNLLVLETNALVGAVNSQYQNHASQLEGQIRNLQVDKQHQSQKNTDLETMMERERAEGGIQQAQLRAEIDLLRKYISETDVSHRMELDSLRERLKFHQQIQSSNNEKAFSTESEILASELNCLKGILGVKASEIQTLIEQNQKQKAQHEIEIGLLRSEISDLKQKLYDAEKTHQENNNALQDNLERRHQNDNLNLRQQYEHQIDIANSEIKTLKEFNFIKTNEIEKLILDKNKLQEQHEKEIINLQNQYKRQVDLLEDERLKQQQEFLLRIDRLNDQNFEIQTKNEYLNQELQNQRSILNNKQRELENNILQNSKAKVDYEDQIRNLKNEIELIKLKNFETEKNKNLEIQELNSHFQQLEYIFKENNKQHELEVSHLKYEMNRQKEMYNNKSKECENVHTSKQAIEIQLRKFNEENDLLIQKLQQFESEKNIAIEEVRKRLDEGTQFQLENLKKAYNTQVLLLSEQISDLKNKLNQKHKEYIELLDKYTILDRMTLPDSRVTANFRNSIPAEIVANKAVHDVLQRSIVRGNF